MQLDDIVESMEQIRHDADYLMRSTISVYRIEVGDIREQHRCFSELLWNLGNFPTGIKMASYELEQVCSASTPRRLLEVRIRRANGPSAPSSFPTPGPCPSSSELFLRAFCLKNGNFQEILIFFLLELHLTNPGLIQHDQIASSVVHRHVGDEEFYVENVTNLNIKNSTIPLT